MLNDRPLERLLTLRSPAVPLPQPHTQALKVHNNVLRQCKWDNCGFTLEQEGDSFGLVFHTAMDAVVFCLQVGLHTQVNAGVPAWCYARQHAWASKLQHPTALLVPPTSLAVDMCIPAGAAGAAQGALALRPPRCAGRWFPREEQHRLRVHRLWRQQHAA